MKILRRLLFVIPVALIVLNLIPGTAWSRLSAALYGVNFPYLDAQVQHVGSSDLDVAPWHWFTVRDRAAGTPRSVSEISSIALGADPAELEHDVQVRGLDSRLCQSDLRFMGSSPWGRTWGFPTVAVAETAPLTCFEPDQQTGIATSWLWLLVDLGLVAGTLALAIHVNRRRSTRAAPSSSLAGQTRSG